MLLRKIKPFSVYVNRTRYIIEKITPNVLFLISVSGPKTGERLLVPRINCTVTKDDFLYQYLEDVNFQYGFALP